VNLTQLRAAQPDVLSTAAEQSKRLSNALEESADRIRTQVRRPLADGSWQGTANASALAFIDRLLQRWDEATARMTEVSKAVWRFADAVELAQTKLDQIERTAAGAGLGLQADGGVQLPPEAWFADDSEEVMATAQQVYQALTEVLTDVTQADVDCAAVFGLPPASEDDGGWLSDLWGAAGWFSGGTSVLQAVDGFLPGGTIVPTIPGLGPLSIATGIDGFLDEYRNLDDPATRRDGFGAWAQSSKATFNLSSVAFTVVPHPVTGVMVLSSAAMWGGFNLLDTHWDTIADGWERANELGWGAASWGLEQGGNLAGEAGDALGAAWDTGGDALGEAWDTGGDVLGGVGSALGIG
jgi:hypothetical protein